MSGEITWWVPLAGAAGAISLLFVIESTRRSDRAERTASLTPEQLFELEKLRQERLSSIWRGDTLGCSIIAGLAFFALFFGVVLLARVIG